MAKGNLDIEDIRTLQELMGGRPTQTVVPTMQVTKDSFSSTVDGITRGWPFIIALITAAFWVIQGFSSNAAIFVQLKAINDQQDIRISQNADAIKAIETKLDAGIVTNNDIIRRLDSLQTAVEALKAK